MAWSLSRMVFCASVMIFCSMFGSCSCIIVRKLVVMGVGAGRMLASCRSGS